MREPAEALSTAEFSAQCMEPAVTMIVRYHFGPKRLMMSLFPIPTPLLLPLTLPGVVPQLSELDKSPRQVYRTQDSLLVLGS